METPVPPPKGPQQATAASLREPCGIGDLPPEVLLYIFQFFNVNQLESTISPVCQLWSDLSQRPCLRLQLALDDEGLDTAAACELLRSCPKLKDLSISKRDDADLLLHHVALYNHELHRLAVGHYNELLYSDRLSEQILDEVLICCPHIVDLTIRNSIFECHKLFRDLGVRLFELRRINFNYCPYLRLNDLRMIFPHCGKLEEIRALTPVGRPARLFDEDILLLAKCLCGTLKVLEIDGDNLSDNAVAGLGQCCQLRELNILNGCEITDDGVSHLSRLQNLECLDLTELEKVSSCGWVQLFFESRWRQMKKLTLVNSRTVNDETLLQVATTCPKLVELNLAFCNHFTDEGLKSVLRTCTDLEYLRIWTIQKCVFRSFFYIPLHTRKLKSLRYKELGVEGEYSVLMQLKDTIPELQIIRW